MGFSQRNLLCVLLTGLVSIGGAAWSPAEAAAAALTAAAAGTGMDRTPQKIRVTGKGFPPADGANPTVRRELAHRAALSDAERKLVQAVAEIKAGSASTRPRSGNGTFVRRIEGFVKGFRVVGERELDDGSIELDIELRFTGRHDLSRLPSE
jgi:hypothetical protein